MLVVDDENGPRQSLRMLLKEEYAVYMASGVASALKILEKESIDLVITDIRMPNRSGLELLREVKQRYPDVQVIILTGYGQLDTAMEAIEYGAFAYIEKPFDNEIMLAKIHAGLEKRRQEQDRRNMEYLALEANRFQTMGHLVSGALHDLSSPLSVIGSHLEVLQRNPNKPDVAKRLEIMKAQVAHCCDLVRTTMNFLRRAPENHVSLNLNNLVHVCLDFARPFFVGQDIATTVRLLPDLPSVEGDLVLVRQAVLNLIYNACQAMQDESGSRELLIETWTEGDYVCLAVQDTGPGVPPEDHERIFDTLYTTKGDKGTGLGLTVVKNVMSRHGGEIHLAPSEDGGARFVMRFPVTMPDDK